MHLLEGRVMETLAKFPGESWTWDELERELGELVKEQETLLYAVALLIRHGRLKVIA